MASVCRYNHDIADYALAVAAPGTGGEALAAMLIRSNREETRPPAAVDPGRVLPASATEPLPASTQNRRVATGRRGLCGRPNRQRRTRSCCRRPLRGPHRRRKARTSRLWPRTASSGTTIRMPGSAADSAANVDADADAQEARNRSPTWNRPRPSRASPAVYSALVHASDAGRAKQLTLTLCWQRGLPAGTGQAMGLAECLRPVEAAGRLAVIGAYWTARQRAAQYQVLAQEGQWLDELTPAVLQDGSQAAVAMLQLRQARLAGAAAGIEAKAALMEAQFALAKAMGPRFRSGLAAAKFAPPDGPGTAERRCSGRPGCRDLGAAGMEENPASARPEHRDPRRQRRRNRCRPGRRHAGLPVGPEVAPAGALGR